jgi:signal transduction histidine kinase
MFTSLRTRLLLTYALVIMILICVLSVGIISSLRTNPLTYRQATQNLFSYTNQIQQNLMEVEGSIDDLPQQIRRFAEENNLWLAIVRLPDLMVVNTRDVEISQFNIKRTIRNYPNDPQRIYRISDAQKQTWLFTLRKINDNTFLFSGILQPNLPAFTLFRNELADPIFSAGTVALFLAILFSLTLSAWIANPLRRMSKAAGSLTRGSAQKLPLEGPREVRQLGEALNQMSDQVKASQDSQKDFIANVSHELKTPLTSIQGYAQALSDGTVSSPNEIHKAAEVILTESQRMNRLVMDLLSLARLEAGTADLEKVAVDLKELLAGMVEQFSLRFQTAGIHLESNLSTVPTIMADGDRLAQVFGNLIDNAIKFTPPAGLVKISCAQYGDWIEIRVTDSGAGIPESELSRVFERFYQVEKSRQRSGSNSAGLGLAIARQIILAHGGEISAQSLVGQGSVFVVKLPVTSPDNDEKN